MKKDKEDISELLIDLRYKITLYINDDEAYVNMLDFWLENWLYYKDHCPCCGDK